MSDECGTGGMRDCSEVLAELEIFLDGELADADAGQIAQHLGDCPPCKDRADLEERVRDLLRSRCVEKAPRELVDRLQARLQEWSI